MNLNRFLWIVLAVAIYSCKDSSSVPPQTQGEFDYHSTQDVDLNVFFESEQGKYLTHIPYEVSTTSTFDSTTILARYSTGLTGSDELKLNIPTAVETLYVRINYNGLPTRWQVAVTNGTVNWSNARVINEPLASMKAPGVTGGRAEAVPYTINYMGTWDNLGRPNYLEPTGDVIDAGLLARLNTSLPEYQNLNNTNPTYITRDDKSIEMLQDADVWITFISEGAGYTNSLAYYVYDKATPPATAADLKTVTVIFPNASFVGSGGGMHSGDKVYLGQFKAGQILGWAIFSNGWSGGSVTTGLWTLYSTQALNSLIADPAIRQQNVLLNDAGFGRAILGFEDIRRDYGSSDQDFNDILFSISSNPIAAINTQPLAALNVPTDADGDGVTDKLDAYPTDPARAYNQYFPAQNAFNTLAYEDLWPGRGDYDFNDLIMGYTVQQVLNAANNVVDVNMTYQLRAVGGSRQIGFAVQLPVSSNNLKNAVITPAYTGNSVVVNGVEANQTSLVFPLFDDAHKAIKASAGSFTNTVIGAPYINPVTITLNLTFNSPVSQDILGTAPYNSFIFVNDRSVEVHLPNMKPTDLADQQMFGSFADRTNPATGKYYQTYDNKPWALLIPGTFDYPMEKSSIESTYLNFVPWAISKGGVFKDWYTNTAGYRNSGVIYTH